MGQGPRSGATGDLVLDLEHTYFRRTSSQHTQHAINNTSSHPDFVVFSSSCLAECEEDVMERCGVEVELNEEIVEDSISDDVAAAEDLAVSQCTLAAHSPAATVPCDLIDTNATSPVATLPTDLLFIPSPVSTLPCDFTNAPTPVSTLPCDFTNASTPVSTLPCEMPVAASPEATLADDVLCLTDSELLELSENLQQLIDSTSSVDTSNNYSTAYSTPVTANTKSAQKQHSAVNMETSLDDLWGSAVSDLDCMLSSDGLSEWPEAFTELFPTLIY